MSVNTFVCAALTTLLAAAPAFADQRREPSDGLDADVGALEPVRQTIAVWFHKPVKVGDRILLGKYLIEHDNDRMARGRPCTYIYAASDPRLPVVAFHCRHVKKPLSTQPTLVMRSLGDANGMTELVAFQFAQETAAHGVPTKRNVSGGRRDGAKTTFEPICRIGCDLPSHPDSERPDRSDRDGIEHGRTTRVTGRSTCHPPSRDRDDRRCELERAEVVLRAARTKIPDGDEVVRQTPCSVRYERRVK